MSQDILEAVRSTSPGRGLMSLGENLEIMSGWPDVLGFASAIARPGGRELLHGADPIVGERVRGACISDPRLRRALTFIADNLSQSISLEVIAGKAGISKYHFTRLFHAKVGQSPIQYLLDRRLDLAACLLAATDLPINQVAFKCGFINVSHFNNRFRQKFGQAPSRYRNGQMSLAGQAGASQGARTASDHRSPREAGESGDASWLPAG